MGKKIYPRTVVEQAPSHDGKPCFAAWEMTETDPDTQTPPDASNRPKWSIQLYDTTSAAGDHENVKTTAKRIEESTLQARSRREARSRVEVHGLPLPADTPEAERVALCMAHHRAEIAARNASGTADFFIPPTFDDLWQRRIVVIVDDRQSAGEGGAAYLVVFFDMTPEAAAESPGGPDYRIVRVTGSDLGDGLQRFTSSIEWFYDSYVADGTIYSDLDKSRSEA